MSIPASLADPFLALLRCAVTGAQEEIDLTGINYEALFSLAKLHDLAHLVHYALTRRGAAPGEAARKFQSQFDLAVFRQVKRELALAQVREALEAAQIPYVLLKGAVLMELYPEPWMRTSADLDVLVPQEAFDRAGAALKNSGFRFSHETHHDSSFFTPENYHIELHHSLIEDNRLPNTTPLLENLWDQTTACADGRCERRLPDALFYFYHIAHMAKHFQKGGCGIRSLLDLWLLNHAVSFDPRAREQLLARSGLKTFATHAVQLSEVWFSKADEAPALQEMADYLLSGGVFGSWKASIIFRRQHSEPQSRARASWKRVFLPYARMRLLYPVLKKLPVLLPVFWVVRLTKLLDPAVRKRVGTARMLDRTVTDSDCTSLEALMRELELW